MAVLTFDRLKSQLSLTSDVSADDALLAAQLEAAQAHIERLLGYRIEDLFGGEGQEPVPEPLIEACAQLAAWWYLQREAATLEGRPATVPFGVDAIVTEYRNWTF